MKPFTTEESENIQKVNDALMKQNQELIEKLKQSQQIINAKDAIIEELENDEK